jgi:hypothetical protein
LGESGQSEADHRFVHGIPQTRFKIDKPHGIPHQFIRLEDPDLQERLRKLTSLRIKVPYRSGGAVFSRKVVDPETRKLIMEIYADDFVKFGYPTAGSRWG